jgi:glycosyltransferase involved in cell wall biosynthesis
MKPLVTALVDTYNHERYIEQALISVLDQGLSPAELEIVVVDDGSTDETPAIIQKFAPRVEYVRKANGGQASAFNVGFRQAHADIVALLDGDDYFVPGKLQRLVHEFQSNRELGMVYHSLLELQMDSGTLHQTELVRVSGFIVHDKSKLLAYVPYPTSCLAFRRSLVQQILPIPESITIQADTYFTLLMPLLAPILAIPEALTVYRVHGHNLFHAQGRPLSPERRKRQFEMFMNVLQEVRAWTNAHSQQVDPVQAKLFLSRWPLIWQEDYFRACPPGRWQFFYSLVRQNFVYRSQQTWRAAIFNHLSAVAALFYGYAHAQRFHEWRSRTIEMFHSILNRLTGLLGGTTHDERK